MHFDIKVAYEPIPGLIKVQKAKSVMIPNNLDLIQHLKEYKPLGFRPSLTSLQYLLGLLTEVPLYDKQILDDVEKNEQYPFVCLSSQRLKKKIHNYDSYLKYLINTGVIETNNRYEVGKYSKGYRFREKYRTVCNVEFIREGHLLENENVVTLSTNNEGIKYSYLARWLNGIQINKVAASKYINGLYLIEHPKKGKSLDKFNFKFNVYRLMIEKIAEKSFFISDDLFSNRLHTSLTNFKAELRKYITYEGRTLASIDLSGSQPFLILNLLEGSFYNDDSEIINLKKINKNINPLIIQPKPSDTIYPIMCGSFKDSEVSEEVKLYKKLVKNNEFYEYCAYRIGSYRSESVSRDQIKTMILSVLFSSNEESKPFLVANKEAFQKLFPFITSVLNEWKLEVANNLSKVLQRIESYLFLECISKRISEERPELPIFTIHDSIVTIEEETEYVKHVMQDEIQRETGFRPHFKTDVWTL